MQSHRARNSVIVARALGFQRGSSANQQGYRTVGRQHQHDQQPAIGSSHRNPPPSRQGQLKM